MTNRKFYAQYCPYGINVSYAPMLNRKKIPRDLTEDTSYP